MVPLFRAIAATALVILSFGALAASANHDEAGTDHPFADPAFEDRWERLDRPVDEFGVDRTYWWGPGPYTDGMTEEYEQSPGGERLVQYFDKSRMEIIDPRGNPNDLWYVTNGLLVVEMIEGKIQIGDDAFRDAVPSDVPVAGDPNNPFGPTYATLAGRLDDAPTDGNALIADRIDRDGNVTREAALEDYEIGIGTYVPETDHSVAAPFWEIMNTNGTIYEDGELTNGPLVDNPFYAVGYPITEPYWSTAVVAGAEQDVLLQCFERRCMTYTPGNEIGFRVEAGNVGQHYYRWRYEDGNGEPETETVEVFFVAIGDNGENGQLIGCQDSLIPFETEIEATDDTATRVERTLAALFGIDQGDLEEFGLYNALSQSSLSVASVTMDGNEAIVDISGEILIGGVCDEPRFVEQIRATVLGVLGVDSATITINGTPLDEIFGPGVETETIQLHFIALGDNGASGDLVGCGDSLVPVDVEIEATDDTATRVERALAALFGEDDDFYGESGLYNSLYQSNLAVASVTMNGNEAVVAITGDVLIGGVCDEPRFEEQIRQTVLSLEGVDSAIITLNGTPLDEFFGGPGEETETVEIFLVAIGDDGQNGIPIGLGDSLIPIEVEIDATEEDELETRIHRTLEALVNLEEDTVEDDEGRELFNALHNSNLTVTSTEVTGGLATVHITGDLIIARIGDEPRVIEQIRQTILQFEGIQIANVFVNGQYLAGYFGDWDLTGGILATFDVSGELFQLWTTNLDTINDILALQAGESEANIPNGPILRGAGEAHHNQPWSWHLDPQLTEMAEVTIELCDGAPTYVEANIDEFVDTIGQYCPWGAELIHVEDLRLVDSE